MWVGGVGIWLVRFGCFERGWERQGSLGEVVSVLLLLEEVG